VSRNVSIVAPDKIAVFVQVRLRLDNSDGWPEIRLADVFTFHNGKTIHMRHSPMANKPSPGTAPETYRRQVPIPSDAANTACGSKSGTCPPLAAFGTSCYLGLLDSQVKISGVSNFHSSDRVRPIFYSLLTVHYLSIRFPRFLLVRSAAHFLETLIQRCSGKKVRIQIRLVGACIVEGLKDFAVVASTRHL
jgi:hypothetical protein